MTARRNPSPLAKCDAVFGKIIRLPAVCVHCGGTDVIQCAHGFSRRYRAVRWDERNAFPLCRGCHMYFTHRPLEWDEWLINRWGLKVYNEIRDLALHGRNPNLTDTLAALRARWAELESEAA